MQDRYDSAPTPHPLPSTNHSIHLHREGDCSQQEADKNAAIFDLAVRECRYCLGGEPGEGGAGGQRLWVPCGCEGAVQLVHEGCFLEWLESRVGEEEVRGQVVAGEALRCKECGLAYIFQFQLVRRWCDGDRFKERAKRNCTAAAVTTTFLILDVVLLGISCGYAISDCTSPQFDLTKPRFYLVYLAVAVCAASLLFAIYQFVTHFCKHEQLVVYRTQHHKKEEEERMEAEVEGEGEGEGEQSQHALAGRKL